MLLHWIWLSTRPNLHDRDKLALLRYFHDPEDIFYGEKDAFSVIDGLSTEAVESLCDKNVRQAHAILNECTAKDIRICTFNDAAYPGRLKNIADPPMVLYYKGRLPDLDSVPVIAAVGTRDCTAYGVNVAKRIGGQIAKCGGIVVSGLAAGIDAAAMAGALSADGIAVGVLGCGVDVVYPLCNRSLFADTERYGCLLSEFPPGTPPVKWNFPKRNRIMSGLSNGVLVVEAPQKSGALITARQAAEQGRDVFVVPGNIDVASCAGSNSLLRDGAIAVGNGWDVVSEYQSLYPDKIRRYDRPVEPAGFVDDVMASAAESEKSLPKVAQKPRTPSKKKHSDNKKEKITIDNLEKPPYSDVQDPLRDLNDRERNIAELIGNDELLVDDLIAKANLSAGVVLSTLTMLEIKGVVRRLPGKRVALRK